MDGWAEQQAKFGALTQTPKATAKPANNKKSWITSLIPAAASILGGIGGTLIAPGVGTAAGGAAGGAIGKKIQDLVTGNHSGLGSYLGEAALGSLGGLGEGFEAARGASSALKAGEGTEAALQALRFGSKGAKALEGVEGLSAGEKALTASAANDVKVPNIISKTGSELRQDVINPKVGAGVGGAQKEAQIAAEASKVPGLSAASKYKNLQGSMNDITSKIDPILEKSTGTTETSKLLDTIRANAEQSPHFLAGDVTHESQLNKVLTDLGAKTEGADKLTAKQLFDYKKGMDMNSVFTKLEKGADLNPKEASRLAVWSSLDNAITTAEPAVKELTKQQSLLMQSAAGLKKGSEKTLGIPLFGLKSQKAEQLIQGGKELSGRLLQKVGGEAAAEAPSSIPGLVGQTARSMAKAQVVPRLVTSSLTGDTPNQPVQAEDPATQVADVPDGSQTADTPPVDDSAQIQTALRAAALKALAEGDTKGLANINAVAGLFASQDKANASNITSKQQEVVDDVNQASATLDTMLQQLGNIGGGAGRVGGLVGTVRGKLGLNNNVSAFNSTKTDTAITLAKAYSGSTRLPSPATLKLIEASMPNYTDNPEEAQAKVDLIKQRLQAKLSTIPGATT